MRRCKERTGIMGGWAKTCLGADIRKELLVIDRAANISQWTARQFSLEVKHDLWHWRNNSADRREKSGTEGLRKRSEPHPNGSLPALVPHLKVPRPMLRFQGQRPAVASLCITPYTSSASFCRIDPPLLCPFCSVF